MAECKHPEIEVELIGQDGNAFNVLGLVNRALTRASVPKVERDEFMAQATAGDYNHLLMVVQEWVTVTGPESSADSDDEEEDFLEEEDEIEEIEDEFADEDEDETIEDLVADED